MLDAQMQPCPDAVVEEQTEPQPEWTTALELMADHARETYRSLLDTEGVIDQQRDQVNNAIRVGGSDCIVHVHWIGDVSSNDP